MTSDSRRIPLAVLLVLHGTKDRTGLAQAEELCGKLCLSLATWRGITVRMYPGFLQFARPSAEETLRSLVQGGHVEKILVVPLMLLPGKHVKRDIPQLIEDCLQRYGKQPGDIRIAPPLGVRLRLAMLARWRSDAAMERAGLTGLKRTDIAYIMVSTGSREQEYMNEMKTVFTIAALADFGQKKLCFFSGEPKVEDALEEAAASGLSAAVVQPYLLFEGEMTNRLRQLLDAYRQRCPHIQWIQGDVLGPDEIVVQIASDNIEISLEEMF